MKNNYQCQNSNPGHVTLFVKYKLTSSCTMPISIFECIRMWRPSPVYEQMSVKRCWRRWLLTISQKLHRLAFYDFFQWIAFICIYLIRHSSDKIHFYAIDLQNTWKGYTRVLIELTVTAHLFFRVRAPELNTSQRAASAKINVRHQTQGMIQRIKWSRRQY